MLFGGCSWKRYKWQGLLNEIMYFQEIKIKMGIIFFFFNLFLHKNVKTG